MTEHAVETHNMFYF